MTNTETVLSNYKVPYKPYDYQRKIIDNTIWEKTLIPLPVGRGKTLVAIYIALAQTITHDVEQVIVIVPAPLVHQWALSIKEFSHADGTEFTVLEYAGPPKKRKTMDLSAYDFIVVSHNILVKDYARFQPICYQNSNLTIIYDEAQSGLRKPRNKIWRYVKFLSTKSKLIMLSGTPVSSPGDTYGIVKLHSPGIYKNKRYFEHMHVAQTDFFGNVTEWKDLPLMKENLFIKSILIEEKEMGELPDAIIIPVLYQLTQKHLKLYNQLKREQLLETDEGEILDGTEAMRLFHILQRFVTAPGELDVKRAQADLMKLIETVVNEMPDEKIIIFANYRDTNRATLKHLTGKGYKAVAVYGEISKKDREQALDDFINGDAQVLVGQPLSLGVGVDGLQHVCTRMLFIELPLTPPALDQAIGRLRRTGQEKKVSVKFLLAEKTIQIPLFHSLRKKEDLLQQVIGGKLMLKDLL